MIDGIEIGERIRMCQNEVFKATRQGEMCILRLTDPKHRSRDDIREELKLLRDLEAVAAIAVTPLTFPSGRLIEETAYRDKRYNAVLFAFIDGVAVEISSFTEASKFGAFLADLHHALAELNCRYDLSVMENPSEEKRLIHGDFNVTNVLSTDEALIAIDFENACYSTYEYELANAIYMKLFNAREEPKTLVNSHFISGFLAGYTRDREVDLKAVRSEVDGRVARLKGWIDELASAPISISTSSKAWKRESRNFVDAYLAGEFEEVVSEIHASV